MVNYDNLALFLKNRIYLIDITKFRDKIVFVIEEFFKNYELVLDLNSLRCSCDLFKNRCLVCKHMKFIIQRIDHIKSKRSKSYNELNECHKLFYVDIKKNLENLDINLFESDYNPRYKEYKILLDNNYNGNCYICLEKLSKKIIRCKKCNKYYHENCIYGWLRCGPACTCPICRNQWV